MYRYRDGMDMIYIDSKWDMSLKFNHEVEDIESINLTPWKKSFKKMTPKTKGKVQTAEYWEERASKRNLRYKTREEVKELDSYLDSI